MSLNPDNARVLDELALLLARSGRSLEALSLAKQSVELAPWDAHALATLSAVYGLLGNCRDALEFYKRARRLSLQSAPEQLVEVEGQCLKPPAP